MPRSVPQVAHSEDYDSDANSVKPGTRKEARRRTTISRPPKALDRYRSAPRDGTSDSGYSSHTSGAQTSNVSATAQPAPAVQAPLKPVTAQGTTKTKPVLHRSESQRSKDKTSTRSSSTSRQREQCGDLNCQHALCHSVRSVERQQTASQSYPIQYAPQYAATPQQYQQQTSQYQYQYAQVPQVSSNQTVPVLATQPRPRQGATSRPARPVSFHGYPFPGLYSGSSQGPPPSASAYQNMQYAAWVQAYQQQQQAYQQANAYSVTPINPNMTPYPQQSPVTTSPTSPHFNTAPEYQVTYSARANIPGYEAATQRRPTTTPQRTYSTRPAPARASTMPGAFPRDDSESSEASSGSDSSPSEYSEEEYERDYRSRPRGSRLISSSYERRPSIKKQYATAPIVPTRSSRDVLSRNPKTDTGLDYISSSDNMDSDRTACAVVDRPRTTYTDSSRSSRRPSISTTASSGRTKATTISSSSGLANVTVERNGRHITYLSQRDREAIEYARQQMEDQRLEDEVRAYQDDVRGSQPPELTVDNIREHERRRSQSHFSGHSRRTSRSSSRNPEAMKIESGGAVIHVYPGSTVSMRQGRDGAPTLVIGTPSGKDSSYHSGSKSSGNRRTSRSYGGSDEGSRREETIREDDSCEQPTN